MIATEADAAVLGLNAVSDGRHVVLTAAAADLAQPWPPVVSCRSRSTSPSCSRAAAASSAARSSCAERSWSGVPRDRSYSPRLVSGRVTASEIALDRRHAAHNYHPLPVVIAEAEGAWVTDVEGRRYLDCLAAYSAVNFGHRNPEIIAAARRQLDRVTLVSRAFHSDQLGTFAAELCRAVRQGHGAADEHRRRGGGERHQGGPQVGPRREGRSTTRTSWWPPATSTGGRPRSSASPTTRTPGTGSARTRPVSAPSRTGTPRPSPPPSTTTRWRC